MICHVGKLPPRRLELRMGHCARRATLKVRAERRPIVIGE
jgi:hypothetical protein